MNTQNTSDTQTDLSSVLEKIAEIAEKSDKSDYIYRGEPECYDKVSSTLYREYETDIEAEHFDIEIVQNEILKEAKEYTHKTDEFEILAEFQHHGGKTNLIDFTTDYLIALFFACDGNRDEPGRVILLQNQSGIYKVVKPPRTIARAGIQKSIFVQAPSGVVDPDTVVCIPVDLKGDVLNYLRKHHDISTKTIYNDLQGFIENWSSHKSAYTEFYKGVTCQDRADSAKNLVEKQKWYDKAVAHYTEAIDLNPDFADGYNNRGATYYHKGDFDRAIQDYNTAINLNPEDAKIYNNRGNAYANKGEFDRAIQEHNIAIDLNPEDAKAYYNRGNTYYAMGDFGRATLNFIKAIDLNPNFAKAYANRGIVYSEIGDFDRAIQDYSIAIDLNPDFVDAYYNRAAAYAKKGELDAAIQDVSKVIALNPEDADAYNNRGNTYGNKGEINKAIQDYNKAIDSNPEYTYAYKNRGVAWLRLREWEKAKADFMTAKDMGIDIVAAFHNAHGSVENFEVKHGVKVPEDIAALLSRD